MCHNVCTEFAKLLSVLLKIFCTLAVKGFCPIKGFEDVESESSNDMEFKSSEEESGLGEGEGNKDISDQIDNEDMLDGAYDPAEKREEEQKNHEEEDNGIEMSENFDSQLQDKKEEENENEENENDENKELEDEVGEVEGNEELDKEMWGDEDEKDENDEDLGESNEQGKTEEQMSEDLSSNDKPDSNKDNQEKRQRKEDEEKENEEDQEFDDSQVDENYDKNTEYPEPEALDLPEDMAMEGEEQQEQFEEPGEEDMEPDVLPDFEDKPDDIPDNEEENEDASDKEDESTEIDQFGLDDENPDTETQEQGGEEEKENETVQVNEDDNKGDENSVAMEENKKGKDSIQNQNEFDESKKEESEGMNESSQKSNSEDKSFNVSSKASKPEEKSEETTGQGTAEQQQKSLAEDPTKAERLDLVEGNMTGEEGVKNPDTFQHVMDQRDDDRSAVDRAEDQVKDQLFTEDFQMDTNEDEKNVEDVKRIKEENTDQNATVDKPDKSKQSEENNEDSSEKQSEKEKEFIDTMNVSRGNESLVVRQDVAALPNNFQVNFDTSLSLQQINLSDSDENNAPVMTQLSHSLSEQLRLILNPTKASSLQGDFRTGKRLNMRKIIPFIASDFKKDKIWLRRTKPTKREFQILVALDDSSSMADNKSRSMALQSLNTISSALALLEAGQLGVLRFGESAEVVHPLHGQWSQSVGHKIQNQFKFDQKKTSVISLLQLTTALFHRQRSNSSTQTALSQLLVIISDGRGVFHEGKEKVIQSVVNARCAGYFCLYLIVENPENKDSVLDIRQPVFNSKGELEGIHSYMDSFPFQHYIILRDVENLPSTLSDALRQWFQLVCSS
eukprot:TRINITY_DN7532_c0_g1_i8.p1 TRINITY_DN7532_c0_g1~~TRINITY_DN7532_c0_g1_i8.p1  ORF type:complete len:973 (-),score=271.67 TRINITY_DN7532_c0_g1_i8:250-2781(-)